MKVHFVKKLTYKMKQCSTKVGLAYTGTSVHFILLMCTVSSQSFHLFSFQLLLPLDRNLNEVHHAVLAFFGHSELVIMAN